MSEEIPNSDEIKLFFHCALCLDDMPLGESPQSYQRIQVGFTKLGLQVWCIRHDVNIAHIDFEGQKHPANMTRKET